MTKKNQNETKSTESESTLAKSDDGTIQITFTIPFTEVSKAKDEVVRELSQDMEIPGFRKGMAPQEKVLQNIPENTILEKTLSKILPRLLANAIEKYKIKPAIYPKFELINAKENENWQIRAVTCEIPDINLGDYKKIISDKKSTKSIWTPDKENKEKVPTREEKEQEVIKILLENNKIVIPKVLIEEEVNSRLSRLLERLEKLGLTLESYLSSIGKTAQLLREEYEKQSRDAILLDLILNQVAIEEKIIIDNKEIEAAIEASRADKELSKELDTPEHRKFIEIILKRRKALDNLISEI